MDKVLEIGQTSAIGSVHLFIGRIVSTIILAIGTIVLGLFILETDYGLYTIALIPAATFLIFQDWGLGSAITRYCAKYRSANAEGDLKKVIISGFIFEVITGVALTAVGMVTAFFIASSVFGKPEAGFLIVIASVTILSSAIGVVPSGVFVGFENMKISSWLLIILSLIQGLAAPLLVYLGYGAMGALIAFTVGSVVTGLVSIILMYFLVYRKLPHVEVKFSDISQTLKSLLNYSVPLSIGNIINGVAGQFVSIMMASFVTAEIMGSYKISLNFAILLTFVTIPVATVLLPAFSKLNPENEKALFKTVFEASVKYASLLLVPATMAMIVLSEAIIGTIYGHKWAFSPLFLALGIVTNIFVLIGSQSITSLLCATGETKVLMKMYLLFLGVSIPIGFLLIPSLGVVGALLTGIFASLPRTLMGLYHVSKKYGINVNFNVSAKIFVASAIPAVAVYFLLNFTSVPYWAKLIMGTVLFLVIYLFSAPLLGAVTQTDLNTLRGIFSKMGVYSKVLEIPLKVMEAPLGARLSRVSKKK